ncbi:MAG: hypothetical protein J4G16_13120 [Acidobacteria bacterium]|nr:hypothetical protein [Acidobacteriota bacterium]
MTLGLLTTATTRAQEWERLPDMPVEKWEPGTVVLDGKLYLFGGYTAGVRSSKLAHVFDPAAGSWTRIQDLPSAITHMNLVLDGRKVWFAGGFKDGYRGHAIAEVWSYDFDAAAAGHAGRRRARPRRPQAALHGRRRGGPRYGFPGPLGARPRRVGAGPRRMGGSRADARAPQPVLVRDVRREDLRHRREQLDQARVDVYDPATDTWTAGPPLPKGHSHAEGSTFVHDGRIYMAGGHTTAPGESKQVDPDILALSPGGDWEVIGKLPMPLSSPAAAIIDGRFYVAGGSPGRSAVQADMWVGRLP